MAEDEEKKEVKMDSEAMKVEMDRRKKAAEEEKKVADAKKAERQKVINERVGEPRNLDGLDNKVLTEIMNQYYTRVYDCESNKYELERKVQVNTHEIHELKKQVMDLRGKFIKPKLRKVSMEFDDLSASKEQV